MEGKEERVDREWIEKARREAQNGQDKLEVELKGYLTNLIKESIRVRLPLSCFFPSLTTLLMPSSFHRHSRPARRLSAFLFFLFFALFPLLPRTSDGSPRPRPLPIPHR
jgi:hypothetical protein